MNARTKKLTTVAMLCAIAFIAVAVGRIPVVMFLDYEPKDVIVTIGGFLYGPLTAAAISFIVSLTEMLTISDTGPIGLMMNILSTCAFSCTAAFIYKKKRTLAGAACGLAAGLFLMTAIMLLWNYIITPIYMGYPREAVVELLLPVILPFNLVKAGLNAAFTLLLYKPLVGALRKTNFVPASENAAGSGNPVGVVIVSLLIVATCVLVVLALRGVI